MNFIRLSRTLEIWLKDREMRPYSNNQLELESGVILCDPGYVYLSLSQNYNRLQRMGRIQAILGVKRQPWSWGLEQVVTCCLVSAGDTESVHCRAETGCLSFDWQHPKAGLIPQVRDFMLFRFKVTSQLFIKSTRKSKSAWFLPLKHGCNSEDQCFLLL